MILDIFKEYEVHFSLKNRQGEEVKFKGIVSAETVDLFQKLQEELQFKMMNKVKSENGNIKGFNVKEEQFAKANGKIKDKVISSFLGDQYEQYLEVVETKKGYADDLVSTMILENINRFKKETVEEDEQGF